MGAGSQTVRLHQVASHRSRSLGYFATAALYSAPLIHALYFAGTTWSTQSGRWLVVIGIAMTVPATILGVATVFDFARRLWGSRQGRISLAQDHLTIHDRWMLSDPIVIERSDVAFVEAVKPPSFRQQTVFALPARHTQDAVLDPTVGVTTWIRLKHRRRFVEALRHIPSNTSFQRISKNRATSGLLVRIESEQEQRDLIEWAALVSSHDEELLDRPLAPRSRVSLILLIWLGVLGYVLVLLGASL